MERRVRMACCSCVFIKIADQQWNFNEVLQDGWPEALLSTVLVCFSSFLVPFLISQLTAVVSYCNSEVAV